MGTRRPSRTGIFTGETLQRRSRPHETDPTVALAALGGVTYRWDLATDRLTWGPNAAAVLGIGVNDLAGTGRAFRDWVEPLGGPCREDALASNELAYDLRYALRLGPGTAIMVQDAGRFIAGCGGRRAFVRGCLKSDPLARGQDGLPRAIHDRSAFLSRLHEDVAEALRFSHGVTLIAGAIVEDSPDMPEILRLLRPMMRRRDHVTALSGNRFALALTSCPLMDAPDAMKRLTGLLSTEGREIRLAAACTPDHALDACRLLRLAETSLGNDVSAEPWTMCDAQGSQSVAPAAEPVDLVRILNERQLTLALRPIVDAHSLAPALARAKMASRDGALVEVPPDPDIALLVDARKLELAAQHLLGAPDTRIILPIEIATLRDPEWLSILAAHLGARPGIASRLIVALPEAVLVEKAKILGRLDAMKALGIGIALDRFGSGFATCARLRSLPIDLVCIDGVFIQTLSRSTGDRLLVRTLVDIAQHLGIATAAEWVDDRATAEMLRAWGVDYLEGDQFGTAAPAALPASTPLRVKRA